MIKAIVVVMLLIIAFQLQLVKAFVVYFSQFHKYSLFHNF